MKGRLEAHEAMTAANEKYESLQRELQTADAERRGAGAKFGAIDRQVDILAAEIAQLEAAAQEAQL